MYSGVNEWSGECVSCRGDIAKEFENKQGRDSTTFEFHYSADFDTNGLLHWVSLTGMRMSLVMGFGPTRRSLPGNIRLRTRTPTSVSSSSAACLLCTRYVYMQDSAIGV
jgi:hypothetical protein